MSRQESRKLFDDYEVGDVLGKGGFSVVRRGVSKPCGSKTEVAIKTLKRFGYTPPGMPQGRGEKGLASFGLPTWKRVSISDALLTNEILVMRKIVEDVSPHPNVIHLYDVYEDMNGVHLVLELCSGGELFDRIVAQERYSEVKAAAVVRQIASGLGALHRANIIHRDLKPENCLFLNISEDSPLKIMDFGLSSVEDFTDPIVGLFGSIDYVSPEALTQCRVSSASDMWSLGVILYVLLSGHLMVPGCGTYNMEVHLLGPRFNRLFVESFVLSNVSTFSCQIYSGEAKDDISCKFNAPVEFNHFRLFINNLSYHSGNCFKGLFSQSTLFHFKLRTLPANIATTVEAADSRGYFLYPGEFSFDEHTWKKISSSAKQLISSLLAVDPVRRPTAQEDLHAGSPHKLLLPEDKLLQHPWVTGDSAKQDVMDYEVVSRLQSFNARRKLRCAAFASVWSSMVFLRTKKLRTLLGSHDLTPGELEKLRMHFKNM
ncbi:hypothetical protein ACLOJK_024951 [Asimina triloba]